MPFPSEDGNIEPKRCEDCKGNHAVTQQKSHFAGVETCSVAFLFARSLVENRLQARITDCRDGETDHVAFLQQCPNLLPTGLLFWSTCFSAHKNTSQVMFLFYTTWEVYTKSRIDSLMVDSLQSYCIYPLDRTIHFLRILFYSPSEELRN